jgi:hypothetical protein
VGMTAHEALFGQTCVEQALNMLKDVNKHFENCFDRYGGFPLYVLQPRRLISVTTCATGRS